MELLLKLMAAKIIATVFYCAAGLLFRETALQLLLPHSTSRNKRPFYSFLPPSPTPPKSSLRSSLLEKTQPLMQHHIQGQICFPILIFSGNRQVEGWHQRTVRHTWDHSWLPNSSGPFPPFPQLVSVSTSEDIPTVLSADVQTCCFPLERHARRDPQTEISLRSKLTQKGGNKW